MGCCSGYFDPWHIHSYYKNKLDFVWLHQYISYTQTSAWRGRCFCFGWYIGYITQHFFMIVIENNTNTITASIYVGEITKDAVSVFQPVKNSEPMYRFDHNPDIIYFYHTVFLSENKIVWYVFPHFCLLFTVFIPLVTYNCLLSYSTKTLETSTYKLYGDRTTIWCGTTHRAHRCGVYWVVAEV